MPDPARVDTLVHYLPPIVTGGRRAGRSAQQQHLRETTLEQFNGPAAHADSWTSDPDRVTCPTCRDHLPPVQPAGIAVPPITWTDGATPTPDQLRAWLRTFTVDQDARIVAHMVVGMLEDEQRDNAELWTRLERLRAAVVRYRLAWLSARRRAREGTAGRVSRAIDRLERQG